MHNLEYWQLLTAHRTVPERKRVTTMTKNSFSIAGQTEVLTLLCTVYLSRLGRCDFSLVYIHSASV